ncbi:MAG: hypothetical protein A2Z34_04285 [Planctomycetes bacterium RBG_16_59_8]|nr:MAG: hypothetical protein A2Z34_04285 [Planctomycetes bacterium RBG_16_59_8]
MTCALLSPVWGAAEPGYLGVSCEKNSGGKGVVVTEVVSSAPADKAGLRKDDIIEAVDGKAVNSPDDLRAIIGGKSAGDDASLAVKRSGKKLTLAVKLDRRPSGDTGGIPGYLAGQEKKLQGIVERMEKRDRSAFETALQRAKEATVRIRVGTSGGSGVLIDGGKTVLTVGHNLEGKVGVGGEFTTILTDGRKFKSRVQVYSYKGGDWDIRKRTPDLVIAEVINPKGDTLPSIDLGEPEEKGLAVLLGYPLMHARKKDGTIFWMSAEHFGGYPPLAVPSKPAGKEPGVPDILVALIDPVETLEGASGGPLINRKGEVIGLIRAGDTGHVSLTHVETIRRFLKEGAPKK